MPYSFTITYDKVTPESAEHGDYSESGFYMAGGYEYPTTDAPYGPAFREWCDRMGPFDTPILATDYDPWDDDAPTDYPECRAAAAIVLEYYATEVSSAPTFYQEQRDTDYGTGEETCKAVHLDGFDAREIAIVVALVNAGSSEAIVA